MEKTYRIEGMHCGHCVAAVEREVSAVAGVERVAVDLATRTATVAGRAFTDADVAAAVDEAGYQVVG